MLQVHGKGKAVTYFSMGYTLGAEGNLSSSKLKSGAGGGGRRNQNKTNDDKVRVYLKRKREMTYLHEHL